MYFYKFNQYTGKYYTYDSDYFDIFNQMFDEELHKEPSCNMENMYDKLVCTYCGTRFESRNKLFYHLGYNGIDIRKVDEVSQEQYNADDEMGEFGYTMKRKKNRCKHKILIKKKNKSRRSRKTAGELKAIARLLYDLDINNTKKVI